MCTGRTAVRSFVIVASLAAGLAGCASAPDAAVDDERLIGTWRAFGDEATFIFTSTGIYTMAVQDLARPVVGPYVWDKATGTLTMGTRRESSVCGDDTGVYRVQLGDAKLDAQIDRDSCSIRSKLMSKPLRRVGTR